MAEIINLRRARKAVTLKSRQDAAALNREKFGEKRDARALRQAREALENHNLQGKVRNSAFPDSETS